MHFDYTQCKQRGLPCPTRIEAGFVPIYLLIAILILGGLFGAFYFGKTNSHQSSPIQTNNVATQPQVSPTPKSNQTTNWNTYTNNVIGFEFKYPENYLLTNLNTNEVMVNHCNTKNPIGTDCDNLFANRFSVKTYDNSQKWERFERLPINDCMKKDSRTTEERQKFLSYDALEVNLVVDNITFGSNCKSTPPDYLIEKRKIIGLIKGNYIFELEIGFSNAEFKPELDQILSTFKFLPVPLVGGDQNQPEDTSNWKTYSSKYGGYSFKYPAESNIQLHPVNPNIDLGAAIEINNKYGTITLPDAPMDWRYDQRKNILLDGKEAYEDFVDNYSPPLNKHMIIVHTEEGIESTKSVTKIFYITYITDEVNLSKEQLNYFDSFLSTIEFIN